MFIFCRLSIWRLTGFNYGLSYSRRINRTLWLLDVHDSWWSLRISTVGLRGSILIALGMPRCHMLSLFRWLIHSSTLCDPWVVILDIWYFAIKRLCASLDAEAGVIPLFEKKTRSGSCSCVIHMKVNFHGGAKGGISSFEPEGRSLMWSGATMRVSCFYYHYFY